MTFPIGQGAKDCSICQGVGLVGPDGSACACVISGGGRNVYPIWTTKTPTKPGWYWYFHHTLEMCLVEHKFTDSVLYGSMTDCSMPISSFSEAWWLWIERPELPEPIE